MATTLLAVRDLVRSLVEFDSEAYITEDADLNALINERADAFAIAAKAFLTRPTLSAGAQTAPGPYALPLVGLEVTEPTAVFVAGRELRSIASEELGGPSSFHEVSARHPDLLNTPPGAVRYWWALSPELIEIWPAPLAAATIAVMGTGLHGAMNSDSDSTRFPSDLDRPFAYDVAAELLRPRASGSSLERMAEFRSVADTAAATYRIRSSDSTQGRLVRGAGRRNAWRRVGG